jgi:hypothetical protein
MTREHVISRTAETADTAICLAALEAVGKDE